jgi:hypothetical protein
MVEGSRMVAPPVSEATVFHTSLTLTPFTCSKGAINLPPKRGS